MRNFKVKVLKRIKKIIEGFSLKIDDMLKQLGEFNKPESLDNDQDFDLGIAYREMGLFRDAIQSFETAMKNGYSPTDCLDMIGLSFIDLEEYDKAEKVFREGLMRKNLQEHEKLGLSFDLGLALEKQGRLEEALQVYCEVEKLNPNFRDVALIMKEIEAKLK